MISITPRRLPVPDLGYGHTDITPDGKYLVHVSSRVVYEPMSIAAAYCRDYWWVIAALFAIALLWAAWRVRRTFARGIQPKPAYCRRCWYEMTGVPGTRCPECACTKRHRVFSSRLSLVWFRARLPLGLAAVVLLPSAALANFGWPRDWITFPIDPSQRAAGVARGLLVDPWHDHSRFIVEIGVHDTAGEQGVRRARFVGSLRTDWAWFFRRGKLIAHDGTLVVPMAVRNAEAVGEGATLRRFELPSLRHLDDVKLRLKKAVLMADRRTLCHVDAVGGRLATYSLGGNADTTLHTIPNWPDWFAVLGSAGRPSVSPIVWKAGLAVFHGPGPTDRVSKREAVEFSIYSFEPFVRQDFEGEAITGFTRIASTRETLAVVSGTDCLYIWNPVDGTGPVTARTPTSDARLYGVASFDREGRFLICHAYEPGKRGEAKRPWVLVFDTNEMRWRASTVFPRHGTTNEIIVNGGHVVVVIREYDSPADAFTTRGPNGAYVPPATTEVAYRLDLSVLADD